MKTSAKKRWIDVAYLSVIFVVSFLMTVFSVACIAKDYFIFSYYEIYLPLTVIVFCILATLYYYIKKFDKQTEEPVSILKKSLITFSSLFIAVLVSAVLYSFFSPNSIVIASVTMMVTMLLGKKLGIYSTFVTMGVMLAIFVTCSYVLDIEHFNLDIIGGVLNSMIMSMCIIFFVGREYTRLRLTWGTILLGLITTPLAGLYSVFGHGVSAVTIGNAIFGQLVGSMLSVAIFIVFLPLYETVFAVWTNFKLAEICSPSQPLLKELREKAPGTYNHSVSVAHLVMSCADAIELNPYMARACAYFHDVGKMKHPEYFTENQKDGKNPHDDLIPEVSVNMITNHVKDGVTVLKEHHMPETVIKAAYEHHGDATVPYFYMKAQSITEDDLDNYQYRYNAQKPTTKYSALVMICDMSEAILRAKPTDDYDQMRAVVENVIDSKLKEGQFNESNMTVKDFATITDTICDVIPSVLHKRIDYDKAKERR